MLSNLNLQFTNYNLFFDAVYKLNSSGNKDSLGKVSYIDSESMLKEYPDSMLGYTNNYQIYQNTDTVGNDIASMIVQDESQCQLNCNNKIFGKNMFANSFN